MTTGMTISVTADTSEISRKLRIVAKHFAALADELEAPDGIITFGNRVITEEEAEEVRERFTRHFSPPAGMP